MNPHDEDEISRFALKLTDKITDKIEDEMPVLLHDPRIGSDYAGDRIYLALKVVLMELNDIAEIDELEIVSGGNG